MGIQKNFIYSFILTASNYLFPLLIYPYISRILGVEKIGICNFADSIINYFVLFATIGISIIGIREIASAKHDQESLNIVFTSLLTHTVIPTILTSVVFVITVFNIERLYEYKEILFIGLGKIIGTAFLFDWFYKGIENFKFITIRTIAIKIVYVFLVFILIKSPEDYILFFCLTTVMVLANSIYNIFYCRHFVRIKFSFSNYKQLVKPNLINGFYLFLNTMYTTLNVAFLGFVSTVTQVGYYTTATKIFGIILAVYSAFTGVMLPRMSYLFTEEKMEDFLRLIKKSLNILLTFSVPVVVVGTILAPQIIDIISGAGYEGAYIPAMISMPLIFIVGYEQILVVQIITPLKEDTIKLRNSIIGATVGIIGNILIVKSLLAIGATIVWAISEIAVLISAQYYVKKLVGLTFPMQLLLKELFLYLPLSLMLISLRLLFESPIIIIGIAFVVSILYFTILKVYIIRDQFVFNIIKSVFHCK